MNAYTARPEDGAVWITGASTGIGAATARQLAAEGFKVYVSARSEEKLKQLAGGASGGGNIVALPLDVTDRAACRRAVDAITAEDRLAIAIFSAGTYLPVRAFDLNYDSFDKTMAVNFGGVVNCLLPVIEAMRQDERGQIAIIASVAGYGGLKNSASYGASKAALINMAESLKFDLDPMNIKMQIVTPGFVETPLTGQNDFPMPFIMNVEAAATRIVNGLKTDGFEITFPRRFTYGLKFANLLPYPLYFWLVGEATRSRKKDG